MKQLLFIIGSIVLVYCLVIAGVLERHEDHPRFHTSSPVPADADTAFCESGKYGGHLLVGSVGDPKTFNPITPSGRTSMDIYERMFSTLVVRDRLTQEIKPLLAKSWELNHAG